MWPYPGGVLSSYPPDNVRALGQPCRDNDNSEEEKARRWESTMMQYWRQDCSRLALIRAPPMLARRRKELMHDFTTPRDEGFYSFPITAALRGAGGAAKGIRTEASLWLHVLPVCTLVRWYFSVSEGAA